MCPTGLKTYRIKITVDILTSSQRDIEKRESLTETIGSPIVYNHKKEPAQK
jgi:hypothetical protein